MYDPLHQSIEMNIVQQYYYHVIVWQMIHR